MFVVIQNCRSSGLQARTDHQGPIPSALPFMSRDSRQENSSEKEEMKDLGEEIGQISCTLEGVGFVPLRRVTLLDLLPFRGCDVLMRQLKISCSNRTPGGLCRLGE